MSASTTTRHRFNERLLASLSLSPADLESLREVARAEGAAFGRTLVARRLLPQEALRKAYESECGIPPFRSPGKEEPPAHADILPLPFLRARLLFPVALSNGTLTVAMADPLDAEAREAVSKITGKRVEVQAATEEEIRGLIERMQSEASSAMDRLVEQVGDAGAAEAADGDERVEQLIGVASEAPIIRLVNFLLARAIERGASDIHIEPYESELRVLYRIDGVLEEVESPPRRFQTAILSRIKIMARLNIAESRLPQDGRVKLRIGGKEVDFRVATVPTLYGESVVMRILDPSSMALDMGAMGLSPELLSAFLPMATAPYGMVLVTGPTGSGKTTTLYAALQEIRKSNRKIITIEDPVEYQTRGVVQIQVKPQIGLTFASGLRSIVRQDPDVILVGEIRDRETAEIAIHSALTGHLVLSTLHTNDAAGAITRLIEMGVEEYLLPSCLIGVLAQRLVRTVCDGCAEPRTVSDALRDELTRGGCLVPEGNLLRGKGCDACGGTGFRGRTGIYELLPVTDGIKELILGRVDSGAIRSKAVAEGMRLLRDDGWDKVLRGVTTFEEVLRVTRTG
ncbi:MAG: type II secretion system ATPase GspE [Candidatus Deferrimicrobium sp.]